MRDQNFATRRDRSLILAEILEAANEGATRCQIMDTVNLSFRQATGYLELMIRGGFLSALKVGGKNLFETTEKGVKYVEAYRVIKGLLGDLLPRPFPISNSANDSE